ncbi:MAG: threonine synthase [Oligoflexia bacterium]|nr:threonine synthase [Oligoflexia bacterium]MBF0366506.1 threonine synthase [Oligoflexia bacterium]
MVCPSCTLQQEKNQPLRGILEVLLTPTAGSSTTLDKLDNNDLLNFLPVEKSFFPAIPVGNTPLWKPTNLRNRLGLKNLFIKDDTCNPTASFKDRASFLVAAFATKHQLKNIVLASTGNAASSMAGIGAAAGIKVTIFLPKTAPIAKIVQSLQYGANVITVDGNYDNAYDLSLEYSSTRGGFSRNTAYNPLTIEGKKSVSLEIARDLQSAPDYVYVPTGDGVILAGVYKGFRDLYDLKLISKVPTIIAVQSEGSDAIHRAFKSGHFTEKASSTVADSICVDIPRNGFHAVKNLKKYGGQTIAVSDNDILSAQRELSSSTGLFTEPAAATAFAGLLAHKDQISKDAKVVVLVTGHGLKDTASALKIVSPPARAIKNLEELL